MSRMSLDMKPTQPRNEPRNQDRSDSGSLIEFPNQLIYKAR